MYEAAHDAGSLPVACQTWIEGTFVGEFTHSPVGRLPPNGQRVVWDLINIFRFGDEGRLAEEWVRTDSRSFLRQLGEAVSPALTERGATVLLHGRDERRLTDTAAGIAVRAPGATVRVSALEERRSRPR